MISNQCIFPKALGQRKEALALLFQQEPASYHTKRPQITDSLTLIAGQVTFNVLPEDKLGHPEVELPVSLARCLKLCTTSKNADEVGEFPSLSLKDHRCAG